MSLADRSGLTINPNEKGAPDGPAGSAFRGDREGRREAQELLLGAVRVGDRFQQSPDGSGIGGGIAGGPDGYEGHVTFYVAVDDIEEALQKAESLGGTRVMGPETIMDMIELGQFKDPEGHLIGLVKPLQM